MDAGLLIFGLGFPVVVFAVWSAVWAVEKWQSSRESDVLDQEYLYP